MYKKISRHFATPQKMSWSPYGSKSFFKIFFVRFTQESHAKKKKKKKKKFKFLNLPQGYILKNPYESEKVEFTQCKNEVSRKNLLKIGRGAWWLPKKEGF